MYRRLVESRSARHAMDPEITLQFLKSAIYYFLTDRENHQGHLKAIQSILGFTPQEIANIDRARASYYHWAITSLGLQLVTSVPKRHTRSAVNWHSSFGILVSSIETNVSWLTASLVYPYIFSSRSHRTVDGRTFDLRPVATLVRLCLKLRSVPVRLSPTRAAHTTVCLLFPAACSYY